MSLALLKVKHNSEEEKNEFDHNTQLILKSFEALQSILDSSEHAPIIEMLAILVEKYLQLNSENLKTRQETLILYRESYVFLKLYLFRPEQVSYFLEHDLGQTYFLKNILN